MGEATRDNQSTTTEPKKDKRRIQGWIRMHSDENSKPAPVREPQDNAAQPRDRKPRKELEKPVE